MSHKMTDAEVAAFLMEGTRTAKLSTVRADGRPHVAPVWFALDGSDLLFTTFHDTVKANNLRRDPRVCICVEDDRPPFSYVIIEGTATISEDSAELLRWATVVGGRYMGADQAEAFGRRNAVPGELVVRVTPTKITAMANIAE